jgi:hypothetical protein
MSSESGKYKDIINSLPPHLKDDNFAKWRGAQVQPRSPALATAEKGETMSKEERMMKQKGSKMKKRQLDGCIILFRRFERRIMLVRIEAQFLFRREDARNASAQKRGARSFAMIHQ